MTDPTPWHRLANESGQLGGQDTAAARLLALEVMGAVRSAYPMNEVPADIVAQCQTLMDRTMAFEAALEALLAAVAWTQTPDCAHAQAYRSPTGDLRCAVCGRLEEKAPDPMADDGDRPMARGDGPK